MPKPPRSKATAATLTISAVILLYLGVTPLLYTWATHRALATGGASGWGNTMIEHLASPYFWLARKIRPLYEYQRFLFERFTDDIELMEWDAFRTYSSK